MAEMTTQPWASQIHDARQTKDAGQTSSPANIRKLKTTTSRPDGGHADEAQKDRRLQLLLLAFMLLVYAPLLWISWKLSPGLPLDLTFNSMLEHLLHGQFDVDPNIVGLEGFGLNGRVYAYWGIWCALLRFPLWAVHRLDIDMTLWSCLAAVCLAGAAKIRALLLLRRHGMKGPVARSAFGLMLACILLGGPQIGYLRISIYQEVIFWSYAFAALFVYFALKGLIERNFSLGTLSSMALCAGLCVLTRAPTGIGVLLAIALLLLVIVFQSAQSNPARPQPAILRLGQALLQRRILVPSAIVAALLTVTAAVNYFRWGNPGTFANYDLYLDNQRFPDWLPRTRMYGNFNLSRIPFSLMYYLLPLYRLHDSHGRHLFARIQDRLFVRVELPPSSLLLTDLLPLCFIVLLAIYLWKRRATGTAAATQQPVQWAAALAIGLLAPCMLMLAYISVTYRYRIEFYPEIDLLAFLGLYAVLTDQAMLALFARFRKWLTAALIVSIASSFLSLSAYDIALATPGILHQYYHQLLQHSTR